MMQELNVIEVNEVTGGIAPVAAYFIGVAVGSAVVAGAYAFAKWLD